jgi:hypothetical protein
VFRVPAPDPAHDQPGGDVLELAAMGEGGEPDLGDFGVGDPPLLVVIPDRPRVADRGPGRELTFVLAH